MSSKDKRKAKARAREEAGAASCPAPPTPITRVLFIGNSLSYFNSGLWFHLHKLCRAANIKVECTKVVKGGASLEVLWTGQDDQLGDDRLSKARGAVKHGGHDIVVLQEDLPETTIASFRAHVRKFVAEARASPVKTKGGAAAKGGEAAASPSASTERELLAHECRENSAASQEQAQAPSARETDRTAGTSSVSDNDTARRSPEVVLLMAWEYARLGWISQEQIAQAHTEVES